MDYSDEATRLVVAQSLYGMFRDELVHGEGAAYSRLVARIQVSLREAYELGQSSPIRPEKLN